MSTQELQDDFVKFRENCIWLRNCYNTFNILYGSEEHAAALRRSAHAFFSDLNAILRDYFFLQVRRVTDPAQARGRANLTVAHITAGLCSCDLITDEINALSESLHRYRNATAEVVNRIIAHHDYETAFRTELLGAHAKQEIEDFVSNLQTFTDAVGRILELGPLDYRVQACPGDVRDLVRTLQRV